METRKTSIRIATAGALALAASLALAPAAARAEEMAAASDTSASASFNVASRYVWRGQTLSEGFVLQPSITATWGGFSANLWSNVDLDAVEEDDDSIAMNETDLTLSYGGSVGPVALTAGVIHYDFDGADTQEAFLTAGLDTMLSPSLTVYYDFDEGDGAFVVLAISQDIAVTEAIGLTAGASLGVNFKDAAMGQDADGEDFTGLYYGEVSLGTSIPVYGNLSIDPRVAYAFGLGDGKDAIEAVSVDGKGSMFYASVAATIAF
jgi:uncharacterized protein (TIGR02001 family)